MAKSLPNNPTRALFVEQQKKHQKTFLAAVANILMAKDNQAPGASDVAWNLEVIVHVVENLTAPARLWDTAYDHCREVMWGALALCAFESASILESDAVVLRDLHGEIIGTDIADLNVVIPEPDPDPVDPDDDDDDPLDDDDDDGDADGNIKTPDVLYHATPTANINDIMQDGLVPFRRQNVYLWDSKDKAIEVAKQHADPIISVIEIDIKAFLAKGFPLNNHDFCRGDRLQWFTPEVPSVYLKVV